MLVSLRLRRHLDNTLLSIAPVSPSRVFNSDIFFPCCSKWCAIWIGRKRSCASTYVVETNTVLLLVHSSYRSHCILLPSTGLCRSIVLKSSFASLPPCSLLAKKWPSASQDGSTSSWWSIHTRSADNLTPTRDTRTPFGTMISIGNFFLSGKTGSDQNLPIDMFTWSIFILIYPLFLLFVSMWTYLKSTLGFIQ